MAKIKPLHGENNNKKLIINKKQRKPFSLAKGNFCIALMTCLSCKYGKEISTASWIYRENSGNFPIIIYRSKFLVKAKTSDHKIWVR